jgi:hypothetical protein
MEIVEQRLFLRKGNPGELVNSALRSSSRSTKTRSCKAVRFHSKLEHTISFFREDVPLAISTDLTKVDQYQIPFEWEVSLSNFPAETPERLSLPVRVERAFMSSDNTELIGSIAVANIAFHKVVVARYTLDYWKTTSDAVAEFNINSHQGNYPTRYDHFNFKINVADKVNLELEVLLLAVKYCVNGEEYWDNNNSANFQIRFKKKPKLNKSKADTQPASPPQSNMLPKSQKMLSTTICRGPQSIPAAFEIFAKATGVYESDKLKRLINDRLSRSRTPCRLKGHISSVGLEYSTLVVLNPSAQPFSNRYNFDKSLSAAIPGTDTTISGSSCIATTTTMNSERHSARCLPGATPTTTLIYTANFLDAKKVDVSSSTSDVVTSSIAPVPSRTYQALPRETERSVMGCPTYNRALEMCCFVRVYKLPLNLRRHAS